jgi:hypothetical protein
LNPTVNSGQTSFQILACWVDIRYEDLALEDTFLYLAEHARQPFAIRKTLSYEVHGTGPFEIFEESDPLDQVATAADVLHVVYGRVYRRVIERLVLSGWVALHAALATINDSRTLILGHKGAGKTTLATRLLFSGHRVEGDEMALVRGDQALALPRSFHLKPGIVRQVGELRGLTTNLPLAIGGNSEISAFDPSDFGFDWTISVGPIDRVVWISPNHGGETVLERRASFPTIQRILEGFMGSGEQRDSLVSAAMALVSRGGHELTLGDARDAVPLLEARVADAL